MVESPILETEYAPQVNGEAAGASAEPFADPDAANEAVQPKQLAEVKPTVWQRARAFLEAQHLLVFLAIAFIVGLSLPEPGETISRPKVADLRVVPTINVILIFFISGLRLKTEDVLGALKKPVPLIAAMFMILVVTPCVGFLPANIDLGVVDEFRIGLALFCCVPTTLTSGAALVAQGAPRASVLALMTTMITNLIGCVSVPFVISLVLRNIDASIDVVELLVQLLIQLLAPAILGKGMTIAFPQVAKFSKDYKLPLTIFSNFNLVMVVWQSLSRSQDTITSQSAGSIFAALGYGVLLHLIFWGLNWPFFLIPGIADDHYRRSGFLLASQKTLPVTLAIINGLKEEDVGDLGLISLPCIFGHLSQLVIDSFLVTKWVSMNKAELDSKKDSSEAANGEDPQPASPLTDADNPLVPESSEKQEA
ncbi:putative sodium/metabolite cotransporter BASS4 [Diplonema papillatum]|nr:putative sodium/metabolite cotransporter BASS4 [Diplonema papillatum]